MNFENSVSSNTKLGVIITKQNNKKINMKRILGLIFILGLTFNLNAQAKTTKTSVIKAEISEAIPIKIWNDLIFIDAKINGVQGTFLWDNGFSYCGLDSVFAKKCGLSFIANDLEMIDGNNVELDMKLGEIDAVQFGKLIINKTSAIQINVQAFLNSKTLKVDGVIGASAINRLNWKFDFDKNKVTLSEKPFFNKGIKLKYKIDEFYIHKIAMNLNGYDLDARIDFGSNSVDFNVNLGALPLFANNKAAQEYGITSMSVSGISPIDTTYIVKRDYNYTLDGVKFDILPTLNLYNNINGVNIGNRFFRRYNVIFNSSDTTIILSKRKTTLKELPVKKYGVKLLFIDNKIIVGSISTNPNLKDKQIELKDEVESVNGKSNIDFYDTIELITFQRTLLLKNKPLIVKMKNGITYTFLPENDIEK